MNAGYKQHGRRGLGGSTRYHPAMPDSGVPRSSARARNEPYTRAGGSTLEVTDPTVADRRHDDIMHAWMRTAGASAEDRIPQASRAVLDLHYGTTGAGTEVTGRSTASGVKA